MNTKNDKLKDLKDIAKVKELHLLRDVNKHIKAGWKLIDTYKTISLNDNETIRYCVGWPKTANNDINNSQKIDAERSKKYIYAI